ncbi:MAG TPA: GNAT family N-acetyltransferase [Lactobacillaceae bacterium]|jgi:phosphinothricin acetyltransferase
MNIRRARAADLPQLVAIYNQAVVAGGITADLVEQTIAERQSWFDAHQTPENPLLVVEDDTRVLGYATLSPYRSKPGWASVAEVSYYLDFEARGQGLGSQLLAELLRIGADFPYTHFVGVITAENAASQHLLEKYGFVYHDTVENFALSTTGWMNIATYIKKV